MALPSGTKLLAGSAGLDREVAGTATLRARLPGFDALRTGDLALISLTTLAALDPNLTLDKVLSQVAQVGVSGVVVAGHVPDQATAAADRLGLPLFELPPQVSLAETDAQVTRLILDWSAEIQRRVQTVQNQLTELALQGRGPKTILDRLADLTEKTVVLLDPTMAVRHWSAPRGQAVDRERVEEALAGLSLEVTTWAVSQRFQASDPAYTELELVEAGLWTMLAPALAGQRIDGYLALVARRSAFWEADAPSLRRGAAALAIHLARETAVLAAEDRLQGNLVDDLLEGNYPSAESILARAKRLGFDLALNHVALALLVEPPHAADEARVGSVLAGAIDRVLAGLGSSGPIRQSGRSALALIPLPATSEPPELRRLGERILGEVSDRLRPAVITGGLGRFHPGLEGLRRSGREADQALTSGRQVFGSGRLTYFGDLGIYRLLFAIRDQHELEAFYEDTLGALVDYDRRREGDLVKTLTAYFAAGSSPGEAASQLHLHRNTLLYRLNRIRAITGLDLDDPDTRLSLHLALKVGEILFQRA